MPRYRVTLEYDGGPFSGWQRQENGPSIQAALEDAIFRLSGERVTVTELAFDGADRARFRTRLGACQQVFERMLAEDRFEKGRKLCGVELELVLIDAQGRPALAVVPGGEPQREMAMRFGVNLVMYVLTGNYKSDQVHVPAILERLGQ